MVDRHDTRKLAEEIIRNRGRVGARGATLHLAEQYLALFNAEFPCPRCGSEEWEYIDYGGCSECRPIEERESEDA